MAVYNEARKNSFIKYMQANTDDIRLRVPKGTKQSWRIYAEKHGMSMTAFVLKTINAYIENDEEQL